jgi:YVTN family beta-propeller protein
MKFNQKKMIRNLTSGIIAAFLILACNDDEIVKTRYEHGVFIVNEGTFNSNNGSISFLNFDTDSVYNDIFFQANARALGDVVQSMYFVDNKAYIVVNNSNKVEVTDAVTLESKGVIEGVNSPRYFIAKDGYAYISCWGDNSVKVISLETNSVISSISVSCGPEKMCIVSDKLYIANTGGWATDSVISVVDLSTNEVIKNIEVKYTPSDLVVDNQNNIWVLCFGKVIYGSEDPYPIIEESASKIYLIDTERDSVIEETTLFEHEHPAQLEINSEGDLLFGGGYAFNGIYRFHPDDLTFSMIINEFAYGLNIDSTTDDIYITLSPSYTTAGTLKRYDQGGNLLGRYECGIGPNGVVPSLY